MLRALLLTIPLLFLAGCFHHLTPRSATKAATLQCNLGNWTVSESVSSYGRSRSHQVFEDEKMTLVNNVMNYKGSLGMLSVISPDGYALTGAHVLKEDEDSCILASSSENKRLHVCELRLSTKGETKTIHFLQAYPQQELGMGEIQAKTVSTKKIRVVHLFPGRDLALIKLSQKSPNYFELGARPSQGDLLFSSGNSQASQPGASSGVVKKITTRNLIHATLPLAPGDSGGPIMDSSGALVGIAVQGRLGELNTIRFMNHSGIELIPKEEVIAIIRRDRALFSKR